LTAIDGEDKVERATITNKREDWQKEIEVDQIIVCIGFVPKLGFLKDVDLDISQSSVVADQSLRTSLENVYAVGDIANHPGRIKLISTGFGNVTTAINDIAERESRRK
jgi:thioredoxin reductase (NADPH)